MNAREGFRRLGLLLGLVGMVAGAIAGYLFFDDVLQERARYKQFSSLRSDPEVQGVITIIQGYEVTSTEFTPAHPSKRGIHKIIYARSQDGKRSEVSSFEMEDGTFLYKSEGPTALSYLLPLSLPILGFFVPWGVIKILVWVGAGFSKQT